MRRALVVAVMGALLAAWPASAAAPLKLKHVTPSREPGLFTLRIELNRPWASVNFRTSSIRQLTVLYDVTGDGKADYTGRIVYLRSKLIENIVGPKSRLEPVPVARPNLTTARFTHPVDALYAGVKHPKTLRIAVQLQSYGTVSRVPRKGWTLVPEPR